MIKHLLLFIALIAFVNSVHPDHSDRTVKSQDDEGHHIRDHEENDHKRSTQNGNVRTRNGQKHDDELRALVDGSHVRGEDWTEEEDSIIDRLVSSEDDEPRYGDDGHHEREHEEEDHELFQDKDGNDVLSALEQEEQSEFEPVEVEEEETVIRDHEDRDDQDHDRQQQEEDEMEEISDRTHDEREDTEREDVVDEEDIERATGEHEHDAVTGEHEHEGADTEDMDEVDEKPELEYAGQGQGDERARGTFDRDESVEGRHDVFESPQEVHEEPDHDDNRNEEEKTWDEIEREMADDEETEETEETETVDTMDASVGPTGEPTMEPTIVLSNGLLVANINEDRDLENNHEQKNSEHQTDDMEEDNVDKPVLDYAGQGTSNERARGTFERDDTIDGRHSVYDTPAEDHVEDHETEGHELLKAQINEDRDLENNHEQKNSAQTEEDVEHQRDEVDGEEKPELEYAGQGTADERARGTFDRDENVEGRHDVFESPQEIHEEPDHDDNRNEEGAEEETEEEIEGETETEDIDDVEEEEEEETEEVDEEETIEMEDNEEEGELVAIHGQVHTVSGEHWLMSMLMLILTGAAMTMLFIHLLQKCKTPKVNGVDTDAEHTPLIANKV